MATEETIGLSGERVARGFGYLECTDGDLDFSVVEDLVMRGHHHGKVLYVVRRRAPVEWCQVVTEAFDRQVRERGGNRVGDPFVRTQQVGATQFGRNGAQYVAEAQRVGGAALELLEDVPPHAVELLFLTRCLEEGFLRAGVHFGPSRYKNGWPSFATFRRWLDNGTMSLLPHEDRAQLAFARRDGFEIHEVETVTSFNVCLEASGHGGELSVWNLEPDDECREAFGVQETGYPYGLEHLAGVEHFSVRLDPGDVYFLNASYLHGVRSVQKGSRLTAGRFIGRVGARKVVYWT